MQSAYHNLPTVGGVMQQNGVEFAAADRKYETDDQHAMVSFDIAEAYPKEAGIKKWVRTVTLDRVGHRVVIEEDFELERPVPVSFTVMTPRVVLGASSGSAVLPPAQGSSGRVCAFTFDPAQLDAKVETIQLTDASLRESWGDAIRRILLSTRGPVQSHKLTYEFKPAIEIQVASEITAD